MISMIVSSDMAWRESSTCFLQSAARPLRAVRPSVVDSETANSPRSGRSTQTVRIADLGDGSGYSASTTSRISSEMTSITAELSNLGCSLCRSAGR